MFFIILTFFAAIFIEGLGSLVSVIGISALFGANPIIIALAIALDVGKVVTVSLLYTYWRELPRLMKPYAFAAAIVTMIITSSGAAGYLTGEFQKSIVGAKEGDLKVSVMKEQQAKYELRKKQIDDQIASLPTKTTVNQRLRLMNGFKAEQKALDAKIAQIDKELPEMQVKQIGTEAKAGPIVAISKAFKIPMEEAVQWVIGMIIFVFDPLAIFLIIAGNFLWARRKAEKLAAKQVLVAEEPTMVVEQPLEPEAVPVEVTEPQPQGFQPFTPMKGTRSEYLLNDFPSPAVKDQVFFHEELKRFFIYDGERWTAANTVSFSKEPEPVVEQPVETTYEKFEEPTEPVVSGHYPVEEVIPPPTPEPVVEPEPIAEPEPQPVAEPEPVQRRAAYEQTGLLKPVNVELPEVVVVPDDTQLIPMKVASVPIHREEITRSTLGIVQPDPATVVDAQRNAGFRRAVAKK